MATTELKPGARVLVAAEVAQCAGVRDGCTVVRLFCTGIDEAKSLCEQHHRERVANGLEPVTF